MWAAGAVLAALAAASVVPVVSCVGCGARVPAKAPSVSPGVSPAYIRLNDEIMIAGQLFHTGAPVVLWSDPGGYDGYRVEKRFAPWSESTWEAMVLAGKAPDTPNRFNTRAARLLPEELEKIRGGGWDLATLGKTIDQFVLHYDVSGTSRQCFRILHDMRGLSVHFLLDIDGTIYQTLDVKERAWHATTSNDRSVGIEIANMGSYKEGAPNPFDKWYERDATGQALRITIPSVFGDGGVRTPGFVGKPARPMPIFGMVQNETHMMYDLTAEQYDSLIKLTATLCGALPNIRCDYPKDANGQLITRKLDDVTLANFQGVLGHYHIQANKSDPGPALQWEYVVSEARKLMER